MSYADFMTVELARKETTTMLPAQSTGVRNENTIDVEPNSEYSATKMETPPPIHLLPNELLVKIIEKLPRTQWPSLELIGHKFRDAVLLAWGSIREVDMERDFIYSESKAIKDENDRVYETASGRLRLQIAEKTEAILKKLIDYSPFITSLCGLSLITGGDPTLNTMTVQYLAKFEHLETIKFAGTYFPGRVVNDCGFRVSGGIPLINFIEFMESTKSRATLKEIIIDQCDISNDPILVANFDRLGAAFANESNDPTRQLLELESISMRMSSYSYRSSPLTFLDAIDTSRMTELSLNDSHVEPAALTNLIYRAPHLRHLDFGFIYPSNFYRNTPACQAERLQSNKDLLAALESHQQLTSLGFNSIWVSSVYDGMRHRFEAEFKKMLRTIGPRLMNFVFKPDYLPPDIRMGEIRDIIQSRMPQLKSITLDERCAKDPEELRGIADGTELEEIKITAYTYNDNYKAILNEVLSTIISKSPHLKRFIGVHYYPDQRVAVELCKLSDLKDLQILAEHLTEENFVAFSKQVFAAKLEVLHLYRIQGGVELGLIELVGKATQLRELVVYGNVTDRLLECLAKSCPNLEKFFASWTDGITFDGVQALVDHCPKLRWLRMNNTARTFKSSLKNLKLGRYRKLELQLQF